MFASGRWVSVTGSGTSVGVKEGGWVEVISGEAVSGGCVEVKDGARVGVLVGVGSSVDVICVTGISKAEILTPAFFAAIAIPAPTATTISRMALRKSRQDLILERE